MNDLEKYEEVPSTSALTKLGITAVGYTAGGIFIFILQAFARLRGLGLIAGAIVCILGLISLKSKDQADKKAGLLITAAGILTIVSRSGVPLLAAISSTILVAGAFGFLAMGIINGIKFLFGLKKRAE